ncbi:MAG: DUF2191 domain-containing protein [Sphingobium sp.]|nr:DUF2191 domain-containing protein [Sphingobium sp.]
MRTNIVIDDELMEKARRALGTTTKRETVEMALERVIEIERQREIREFRGKLDWVGDLEAMRTDA